VQKYSIAYSYFLIVFFLVHFCPETVKGQSENKCVVIIKETTAAMAAEDWSNVRRLAENFISICGSKFGAESLSGAYEDIAMANFRIGIPESVLSASEACIMTYYGNETTTVPTLN
jgi:hypothetical protein